MTSSIRIQAVQTPGDLNHFIRLPAPLYQHDPNWVHPLHLERKEHLSPANPVFEHLEWQGWIAWRGEQAVGRISAQIDSLHRQHHGMDTGHFGMLEAIDDPEVFAALTGTAEQWLKQQGAHRITGPFSLNINEESGLLTEGFDTPPVFMMAHGQPYYARRLEEAGYRAAVNLLAYWMRTDELNFTPTMRRMMDRYRDKVRIRPVNRKDFANEVCTLRHIFNDAWANNWGFVPFTEAEFTKTGNDLKFLVPKDLMYIAEVDGEPSAFIIALPNLNEAIAPLKGRLLPFGWLSLLWKLKVKMPKTARVPLMGVKQHYQNSRLGGVLALLLIEALKPPFVRHGIEALEMSWILETNTRMRNILENIGTHTYKRYRIYEKDI